MENSLKVLINFDEKITKRQLEKYYYYSWKKKLPSLVKNLFFFLLFIFILDSLSDNRGRIEFIKFAGILSLIFCGIYIILFYFNKANYSIKSDKYIDELKNYNPISELYFDESSFYIKNEQYDLRSVWKKVSYNISENTIIITIDMGTPFTYLVNKEETEQYQDILDFLNKKSKLKK